MALATALSTALAACQPKQKPSWRTDTVARGDVVETVSATGTVGALVTVTVGTQVSGTLARLYVDFNSPVKKGQLLAELDPRLLRAAVARAEAALVAAEAEVERARVQLADAERVHARTKGLVEKSLTAAADLDTALTAREAAQAGLKAAEARVMLSRAERDTAQTNLSLCRITSPIDGVVISRAVDVGQTVAASLQAPTLFTIANDLTQMQILTNIDEADIGKVAQGLEARFTVEAFPGESFTGTIREVRPAPQVVQNVVTYTAVIDAPNPDRKLRHGMTASASIATAKREHALRIPNAALRFKPDESLLEKSDKTSGEKPTERRHDRPREGAMAGASKVRTGTVYTLVDEKPVAVEVTLGLSDGRGTEVTAGTLKEGDKVVVGVIGGPGGSSGMRPPGGPMGGPAGHGGGGSRRGPF